MDDFIESTLKNRLIMSIGTKGSGKSYLMNNYLKMCFKLNLYDQYILILPSFEIEQTDSYSFIDAKRKDIYVFEAYDEMISEEFIRTQTKQKIHTLFVIDDSSSQGMFNIDMHLKHIITVLRHLDCTLWLICHACSNIMSPFIRQNVDILLLSRITNLKLLSDSLYEEFLSLTEEYVGADGRKQFIRDFIELHKEPFKVIYLDLRENIIDFEAGSWDFSKIKNLNKSYKSNERNRITTKQG